MDLTTWDYAKIWFVCTLLNALTSMVMAGVAILVCEGYLPGRSVLGRFDKKTKDHKER